MSKAGEDLIQSFNEAIAWAKGDDSKVKVHPATVPDINVTTVPRVASVAISGRRPRRQPRKKSP